jgi:hypothetical protein
MNATSKIGLCLSGGGFRATFFQLGALQARHLVSAVPRQQRVECGSSLIREREPVARITLDQSPDHHRGNVRAGDTSALPFSSAGHAEQQDALGDGQRWGRNRRTGEAAPKPVPPPLPGDGRGPFPRSPDRDRVPVKRLEG